MTTQDIIDHLDSKPYLDHRIAQLAENITSLQDEKKDLEEIRRYVNQVTDVIDGVPIKITSNGYGDIEIRTVTPEYLKLRWGKVYLTYFSRDTYGLCINGKATPGMSASASTDNLWQGDHFVKFYSSREKAKQDLLDWVVGAKAPSV